MRFATPLIAAAAAVTFAVAAPAEHHEADGSFGPELGANIADVVVATDPTGAQRTLADLSGENGLVLYFSRSVDWCPFCKAQALQVNEAVDAFAERGYGVAFLTTDSVRKLERYVERNEPSMTMLADPDSQVIAALGLLDPSYPEGHRRHGLPYPSTLALSPEGVVQAKLLLEDQLGEDGSFRERITVEDMLAAVDAIEPEA